MEIDAFTNSLSAATPPDVSRPLRSLWYDGKGDWNAAHDELQDDASSAGSWVHAYLHRKEGDLSNAAYSYRRAGKPVATDSLTDEWKAIVAALLSE